MNTSINKKVICVKDIPSNLIEEAIFILKTDAIEDENKKRSLIRKEIILKETEDLVKEYEEEFDNFEIEEEETSLNLMNDLKLKVILAGVLVALVCFLISLVI